MEKNIYKILGDAVRAYRTHAGWSQEELGERAGLHPSYIGQIERCVKKVSIATLQKLSAALKVTISDLLQEKPFSSTPSSWETKLAGIIRDRPSEQQGFAYRIVKEALRPYPRRRK
jgi:XRE family transcriptional regulator, regulator of sulfur utilization